MQISLARLPRLLGVLVFAFAPSEPRPLLAAVELFRGFAIQLSYRWGAGRVFADASNQAVLLWSVSNDRWNRRRAARETEGVLSAVAVGIMLFIAGNMLLLLFVRGGLDVFGASRSTKATVPFAILIVRLSFTMWRAVQAYRHHAAIAALLPPASGPRWRIDFLAATPARAGHGGRLLSEFLELADSADAEVVLNCDSSNLSFYRHHGFHFSEGRCPGGQRLMTRQAATTRRKPRLKPRPG